MSIRYRLKRNSGPVHESIPAHPDAFYRPQYRPTPVNAPPVDSGVIAPRLLANNPIVAAPLAAGGSGFSPWWIIGPLLALLAAMALGALAYGIKKKQNLKKQAEEENNPETKKISNAKTNQNKKENSDDDDDNNAKRLPVENMPLRTIKPDPQFKEEKQTIPLSSTAKGNSLSDTNPLLSNDINKQTIGKSALLAHNFPLTDDRSTVPNILTNPLLHSSLKNIRSVPTPNKEPNHSENLPLTSTISSTSSTTQKLDQPNDGSDPNTGKPTFDESLTSLGRIDHTGSSKEGRSNLPSSRSETNDRNPTNKSDDSHMKQVDSPEQHGIGKSPLISSIPTGSKRSGKEKSSTNPFSSSDINKDENPSTSTLHSNNDPLSRPSETASTNEKHSTSSHPDEKSNSRLNKNNLKGLDDSHLQSQINSSNLQKSNNPNDDKSDESNTSLKQSDLINRNKTFSLMPNVPQCKTNTSSSDDDYDEIYPLRLNDSSIQSNKNASIYRKTLTKRFHLKDKTFHSNPNDKQ